MHHIASFQADVRRLSLALGSVMAMLWLDKTWISVYWTMDNIATWRGERQDFFRSFKNTYSLCSGPGTLNHQQSFHRFFAVLDYCGCTCCCDKCRTLSVCLVHLRVHTETWMFRLAAKQEELYRCGRGECGQLGMKRVPNIGIPQKVGARHVCQAIPLDNKLAGTPTTRIERHITPRTAQFHL